MIDQETLLDSIEYNIEQSSVHIAEAAKELDAATQYVLFPQALQCWASSFAQLSEEYWPSQDYFSPVAHHIWVNCHPYLQVSPPPSIYRYFFRSYAFSR